VAKVNQIIKAFDADELKMLSDIIGQREQEALEEGQELSPEFHDLKEIIQRASKYATGIAHVG
jgi:hypothetical protein